MLPNVLFRIVAIFVGMKIALVLVLEDFVDSFEAFLELDRKIGRFLVGFL